MKNLVTTTLAVAAITISSTSWAGGFFCKYNGSNPSYHEQVKVDATQSGYIVSVQSAFIIGVIASDLGLRNSIFAKEMRFSFQSSECKFSSNKSPVSVCATDPNSGNTNVEFFDETGNKIDQIQVLSVIQNKYETSETPSGVSSDYHFSVFADLPGKASNGDAFFKIQECQ